MSTFNIYTNSSLTALFSGTINAVQNVDGSTGDQDFQFWLGSTTPSRKLQADSDPGVDQIFLSILDAAPGTGHPASDVKLALTQGALTAATGGASLNLGTTILSGVVNAKEFWVRVRDSTGVIADSIELSIPLNLVRESAV